ncbi:MAG: leucine--tRNA ligase [Candidatus Micrarchaeaceae archaeon]
MNVQRDAGVPIIDYKSIEEKWQAEWEKAKIFESDVNNEKKPYMVFAAFPYVNSPQHIGHLRTYGTADILARYMRMRGYNVLFPMGLHATGTPVLAFAKRIANNDKELIDEMKLFEVPEEAIKKMTSPEFIAEYFEKRTIEEMHRMGYSIDWRRMFVSIEPFFSKFVEWQFGILNEKGLLVQGKHPVGWCPNENNAVGMHDTKHDVEPEIEEETAIKFRVEGEDAAMLCSTYRPETIFGVTNIFVNEGAQYILCEIEGSKYYIAKDAAVRLGFQMKIKPIREVAASELLQKRCINPMTNESIPVLPGFFVKPSLGTGMVMSVPAHAPFDYAAIERLRASGYPLPNIVPKKIIEVEIGRSLSDVSAGEAKALHPEIPALAYLEILHTGVNAIDDMLEFATKLQYREESHWGKMLVKGYEGMNEPDAREKVKEELMRRGSAISIYILQNGPVICRCGAEVVVKVVEDQWFLNYGNAKWKEMAKDAFGGVRVLPDVQRNAIAAAIDWINLRAVARAQGLGTRFPLDTHFIIESLSDSTIYPAFYTISNFIRGIDVGKLKREFFDYVFRGIGDADAVCKSTGIDFEVIKRCRESFDYWYKNTSNHSGPDLIPNHITMFIFNHAVVFERQYWPKQIVINGTVLSEGEKMSKSLGNIVPLSVGIRKFGADPLRFVVAGSVDIQGDGEFSVAAINGASERFEYLYNLALKVDEFEATALSDIDYWLYSKMNSKIKKATAAMDGLQMRTASTEILYNSVLELKHYFERGGKNNIVLKEFIQNVSLMLQPLAPHIAEEIWHAIGNNTFASTEKWPPVSEEMISSKVERKEALLEDVIEDIEAAKLAIKKKCKEPKSVTIIVASEWKRSAMNTLAEAKDIDKAISTEMGKGAGTDAGKLAKYLSRFAKSINEVEKVEISAQEEYSFINGAKDYIAKKIGCSVNVELEEASKSGRAERAVPLKPSIDIEC